MAEKEETQVLHMRFPKSLHAALTKYASDSHRSLTNATNHLLLKALEAEKVRTNDDSEEHRDAVPICGTHGV